LPENDAEPKIQPGKTKEVDVLIIGAGPAGLAAAVELGKLGVDTLIIDDKDRPGGKLVLQTHKFLAQSKIPTPVPVDLKSLQLCRHR